MYFVDTFYGSCLYSSIFLKYWMILKIFIDNCLIIPKWNMYAINPFANLGATPKNEDLCYRWTSWSKSKISLKYRNIWTNLEFSTFESKTFYIDQDRRLTSYDVRNPCFTKFTTKPEMIPAVKQDRTGLNIYRSVSFPQMIWFCGDKELRSLSRSMQIG